MYKMDLEKGDEPEIKLPTSAGSQKKQGNSTKTSISASLNMVKPLLYGSQQTGKFLRKMGIPDHLTCLLRNLYACQEAIEADMEQQTGSKLGKEYNKDVYCYPA